MLKHTEPQLQAAAVAQVVQGLAIAPQFAICSTLVALPVNKDPTLIQFTPSCAHEEATKDLPFVAIGSGQLIADPFLAFVRRIFWGQSQLPNINQGVFAALWTLVHTTGTNPGGIGDPIQIAVLKREGDACKAEFLTDGDRQEHLVAIGEAESRLRGLPGSITASDRRSNPVPPLPAT